MKNAIKSAEKKAELESKLNQELIKDIVGIKDYEFALSLVTSAGNALEPFTGKEEGLKAIMQAFRDLKPSDSIEARLIAQSAVLYEFTMNSFKRCGDADWLSHIESMANLGIKLMRVQNETIEALNKYRRGGEQKVTVTHAVMAGQAIVNNHYGEGGSSKNKGDTPCSSQNAEQKQELMPISHVDNLQWPMESADSMEEKAPVLKPKKGNNK